MASGGSGSSRVVGLDLVRALAILFVLLSHCGDVFAAWLGGYSPAWLGAAGFFGVELFFVLSGFLIGGLLLRIIAERPTLRAWGVFLVRRWMRTLPAYLIWIAVLALIWPPQFWQPDHAALTWHHVIRYATLTQNLAWPMTDSWFGVSWSLTVEEWFYLTFSALLLLAAALLGARRGFWLATGVFLVVPVLLRWQVPDTADFNEVLSKIAVLRLDAIAFGLVLAAMQRRGGLAFRHPAPMLLAGVLLIAGLWSGWFDRHLHPELHMRRTFIFDVASLGFALCLPAAARLRHLPDRLRLPEAAIIALSTQSYAIYLVHLSVLEIVGFYRERWGAPAWAAITISLALIWGLSWASWRWIEAPILARRPRQSGVDGAARLLRGSVV